MKLRLKAYMASPSSPMLKTAANPAIVPGRVFKYRGVWDFKIIGLASSKEGWVMEAPLGNNYEPDKDRYGYLAKQIDKTEYLKGENEKKFVWNLKSRYFEFEFDHPIYDDIEQLDKPKYKPTNFVPKTKTKFIFTFENGIAMPDQELKAFPRKGLEFVEKIQRILNVQYEKLTRKYPFPIKEESLPVIQKQLRLRILRPSATKWKSQLIGIGAAYRFWVWALKILEGMHYNEFISQEELEIGQKAIKTKFRLTNSMKTIFENLNIPEEF